MLISMNGQRPQRGSSLIEMMVVVSIIVLLANIGFTMTVSARARARDTVRITDIKTVERALALYYNDQGAYPLTPGTVEGDFVWYGTCAAAACHDTWGTDTSEWVPGLDTQYISHLPIDPAENGCDRCYLYRSDGLDYKIVSLQPENPGNDAFLAFIDPARDQGTDACSVDGPVGMAPWAWSVYSPAARCW